jgi:hypothetical protein
MEQTVGFIQPVGMEIPEGTFTESNTDSVKGLTLAQDQELREQYPANVEGSPEFNETEDNERKQEELKKHIEELLANPQVRANALANANDLKKKLKGWFRVQDAARKTMLKVEPVQDMLNLLYLFEMAYRKEHRGELRYKIILSSSDKLTILQEELKEAERNVERLKLEIQAISNNEPRH